MKSLVVAALAPTTRGGRGAGASQQLENGKAETSAAASAVVSSSSGARGSASAAIKIHFARQKIARKLSQWSLRGQHPAAGREDEKERNKKKMLLL